MPTDEILRLRIRGSEPGYNEQADVLVNETADGVDLRVLWDEITRLMAMWNGERTTVCTLVSYPTTVPADVVPQTLAPERFDQASEFGVPTGSALPPDYLKVGYTFRDY